MAGLSGGREGHAGIWVSLQQRVKVTVLCTAHPLPWGPLTGPDTLPWRVDLANDSWAAVYLVCPPPAVAQVRSEGYRAGKSFLVIERSILLFSPVVAHSVLDFAFCLAKPTAALLRKLRNPCSAATPALLLGLCTFRHTCLLWSLTLGTWLLSPYGLVLWQFLLIHKTENLGFYFSGMRKKGYFLKICKLLICLGLTIK